MSAKTKTPPQRTSVPDPFASPTPPPTPVAATFDDWLVTAEGKRASNLSRLLEVLSQGHPVRSQLAFNDALRRAFAAGVASL